MIAAKPVVLIADDDPVSRSFLGAAIERCGCAVLAVADARAALQVLHSKAPDLLLIDRRMPGMDGVALLRAVRAQAIALLDHVRERAALQREPAEAGKMLGVEVDLFQQDRLLIHAREPHDPHRPPRQAHPNRSCSTMPPL
jgi:CheY-like chemotaxis protein